MRETSPKMLAFGRFGRPKGLKGWIRLIPFNASSSLLTEIEDLFVNLPNGEPQRLGLESVRQEGTDWLGRIEGMEDRDQAGQLAGEIFYVRRTDLPELPPGQFYHCDLEGLQVETTAGASVGVVEAVLNTASNDVLVVKNADQESLFPLLPGVIVSVDWKRQKMVIAPPEVVDAF